MLAPLTGTTPVILGLMSDMSACSSLPETYVSTEKILIGAENQR